MYGKLRAHKRVEEIFDAMVDAGVEPDVSSHNSLLVALTKLFKADKAREVFSRMKEVGQIPDKKTYMIMAEMYAMLSRENDLRKLVQEMLGSRAGKLRVERTMLELYSRLGLTGLVRESLDRFENSLSAPDHESYCALIKGYEALSDPDRVLEIKQEMKRKGMRPPI